jgi:hypothetical protein
MIKMIVSKLDLCLRAANSHSHSHAMSLVTLFPMFFFRCAAKSPVICGDILLATALLSPLPTSMNDIRTTDQSYWPSPERWWPAGLGL